MFVSTLHDVLSMYSVDDVFMIIHIDCTKYLHIILRILIHILGDVFKV